MVKAAFCCSLFCLALILSASDARAQEGQPAQQETRTVFGHVTFSGLLQAWYLAGSEDFDDTFKLRRSELKLTGVASPQVRWTLMVDPAKALAIIRNPSGRRDDSILTGIVQDVFITLTFHQRMNVSVGQFKVPLSLEGLESSAALDTERALFISDRARGGAYGDIRNIGVMAYGPLTDRLDYQVGFFDGIGDTPDDGNNYDRKAVAGRLVYRPAVVPGLQVGTSRVWGSGATDPRARRDRLGAELLYVNGPLTLKAEYMTGQDGLLEREGHYAHFAYTLTPKWEATLRYDAWDPDRHLEATPASVTERDYIAGFNYLVDGRHTQMQFNCVRKTFKNEVLGSYYLAATRLQVSW
jgi:hypothetical protein